MGLYIAQSCPNFPRNILKYRWMKLVKRKQLEFPIYFHFIIKKTNSPIIKMSACCLYYSVHINPLRHFVLQ